MEIGIDFISRYTVLPVYRQTLVVHAQFSIFIYIYVITHVVHMYIHNFAHIIAVLVIYKIITITIIMLCYIIMFTLPPTILSTYLRDPVVTYWLGITVVWSPLDIFM